MDQQLDPLPLRSDELANHPGHRLSIVNQEKWSSFKLPTLGAVVVVHVPGNFGGDTKPCRHRSEDTRDSWSIVGNKWKQIKYELPSLEKKHRP